MEQSKAILINSAAAAVGVGIGGALNAGLNAARASQVALVANSARGAQVLIGAGMTYGGAKGILNAGDDLKNGDWAIGGAQATLGAVSMWYGGQLVQAGLTPLSPTLAGGSNRLNNDNWQNGSFDSRSAQGLAGGNNDFRLTGSSANITAGENLSYGATWGYSTLGQPMLAEGHNAAMYDKLKWDLRSANDPLPRVEGGQYNLRPLPDPRAGGNPHTVLGMRAEPGISPQPYRQTATFASDGRLLEYHFSNHGLGLGLGPENGHTNPHMHDWTNWAKPEMPTHFNGLGI